jgi:hypothetical protein
LKCPLRRPAWLAVGRFGLHSSRQLLGIRLVLECEIHLGTTGIPHHCRCIVAGLLLLPDKPCEHGLRGRQFLTTNWTVGLRYPAHDEMGSRLALLE